MEKSMCTRLNSYIEKFELLYPGQFGFRSGHSTDMALVNIQDLITEAIDTNKHSAGVFLDLAKAFDTVNRQIQIKKLQHYGIRGKPLSWFKDYLNNRFQQVRCNGVTSSFRPMKCGSHKALI